MIADFNAVYPNIKVNVEYLDYTNGDVQVTTAMEAKTTPDHRLGGPRASGSRTARRPRQAGVRWTICGRRRPWRISAPATLAVVAPAKAADGDYYMNILCASTAHCMVIDKAAFEKADALQYIDHGKPHMDHRGL